MKTLAFWSLFFATVFVGCALSPGHDLPSSTETASGDGDIFSPGGDGDVHPGGDGDIGLDFPPGEGASPCAGGGMGGVGGACEQAAGP